MSELLQEKDKLLFINGFIPPLDFHLICFVIEQIKSRKWEVLEILIPILSLSSQFLYWWLAELTLLRRNI